MDCDRPVKGGVRVLITGPHGFERTVTFGIDDKNASVYNLRSLAATNPK